MKAWEEGSRWRDTGDHRGVKKGRERGNRVDYKMLSNVREGTYLTKETSLTTEVHLGKKIRC